MRRCAAPRATRRPPQDQFDQLDPLEQFDQFDPLDPLDQFDQFDQLDQLDPLDQFGIEPAIRPSCFASSATPGPSHASARRRRARGWLGAAGCAPRGSEARLGTGDHPFGCGGVCVSVCARAEEEGGHREAGPCEGRGPQNGGPGGAAEQPVAVEPGDQPPALDVAREDAGEVADEVDVWDDHLGHDEGEEGGEAEGHLEEEQVDAGVGGLEACIGHPGENDAGVADPDGELRALAEAGAGKDGMQALLDANREEEEDKSEAKILQDANYHFHIPKLPSAEHIESQMHKTDV